MRENITPEFDLTGNSKLKDENLSTLNVEIKSLVGTQSWALRQSVQVKKQRELRHDNKLNALKNTAETKYE